MTDYSVSNTRKAIDYSQDTDSTISNMGLTQSKIKKVKEGKGKNKKRLMPKRENAKKSRKDLSFGSTRKFKNNESVDSEAHSIPFSSKKSFKKLGLKDVQKYARNEGPSTGRKSTKSGKDTLNTEEMAKLRDLRSIFYKQTAITNTSEKSARNKSSTKKLSKNSSASFKNSRRSSNKRSSKNLKKEVSPKTNKSSMMPFGDKGSQKMLNISNQFSKSKSLMRGNIKKKKLSKIKLNGRNNKFMNNGITKKTNHNSSNMNSARSKGAAPSGSKESKKSIKLIKKDFIFKKGEGKIRLSKRKKESISIKSKISKKNPLKVLKKISPDRIVKPDDNPHFSIPIERAVQYNNYCKLSGRTKQSSDSGSNVIIRKNSNISRKNRDLSHSRGNRTHLIFLDQQHNSKISDPSRRNTNFNLSGPVNLRQENCTINFDSSLNRAQKVNMARDSNKSQQLVPDTNSTLAYTAACVSTGMAGMHKNAANRCILGTVAKPAKTKYSPHTLYFKRHKKSKESPYCTPGSNISSAGSRSMNNRQPNFANDYQVKHSNNSGSGFGSNNSNLSNKANALVNLQETKKKIQSEEKHLDPTYREKGSKIENQPIKLRKIEGYEKALEKMNLEDKKPNVVKPSAIKLNDSLVTKSSPSRGSAMTNPQGGRFGSSLNNSNTQDSAPLKPGKAIQIYKNILTEYERGEILKYREIYCVGEKAAATKIKGTILEENNCGYDDERGDYNVILNDHLGYRFEVIERLGAGSFGQAYKCIDHKNNEEVAVKIIKNDPSFQHQAGVEVKILTHLRDKDPYDKNNIIRLKEVFTFRSHLCVSFELLSINLYDFLKQGNFRGLSLGLIRRFAMQILYALNYVQCENIIHCDLKPENIVLKEKNKSGLKVIDFGSSCFVDEQLYTYIQSRFYRAPEIIFGIRYSNSIDMWSFGCILAELYTGYPIFPGESEHDQIGYMMEVNGIPPIELLKRGMRSHLFFDKEGLPIRVKNSNGKVRTPNSKFLHEVLDCNEETFLDFIEKLFEWIPEERLSPADALRHEWILEGLPLQILEHHMTLHNIEIHELPKNIRKNFEKFMKNKNKKASKDPTSPKSGSKTLSTSRKPVKHKINTEISHVPVVGGDMITLRNKDKKVNIKKGLENSLLDSLSSKSKSNTRNKDKSKSSKAEISLSNGGDSLKALDELMGVPAPKKVDNSFILKKHNIKFKALRGGGLKRKSRKRDRISENAEKQVLNKSKPLKQSRNIIMESFGPADFS